MLLGSDLPIFGSGGHPAISLRLRYSQIVFHDPITCVDGVAVQGYAKANHGADGSRLLAG